MDFPFPAPLLHHNTGIATIKRHVHTNTTRYSGTRARKYEGRGASAVL